MKKIIHIFSISLAIIMLAACGEGFRSNSASSDGFNGRDGGSEFFDNQGRRRSHTNPNIDLEIFQNYSHEISTTTTRALSNEIRAFDVIFEADANNNYQMRARIVRGCNESYLASRTVQASDMASGRIVDIGRDGPYEVELQCSTNSCEEMVAAIRKVSGSNRGVVLVGLGIGNREERRFLYVSRNVGQTGYVNFQHIPGFENAERCSVDVNTPEDRDLGERLVEAVGALLSGDRDEAQEIAIEAVVEEGIDWLKDRFGF